MNLGEANLRTVNTSKPQLVHANSKQSVTATESFYSLASDDSSQDDNATILYQTPLSHMRSAAASRDALQSAVSVASTKPAKLSPPDHVETLTAVKFSETELVKEKPLSGEAFRAQQVADSEISPTTPGLDDTPYIRYAIEQLTRDDTRPGQRRQGGASDESYPVDRIVSDEGLGYYGRSQRSTRHEREALDSTTRHPESSPPDDVLVPVEHPGDSSRYPKLDFVPGALRLLPLAAFFLCCLLMITALIFCNVWSSRHDGFLQYDGVDTSRYFLFQFLPQILAIIMILWLFIIQRAIQRIFPFCALSAYDRTAGNSNIFDNAALFPSNFLIPNFAFFRYMEPALGFCFLSFWLSLFTVPLQGALFQTRYFANEGEDAWRWTTVRPVGWTLLALYILLAIALMVLMLRFRLRPTGLKWDPVSLADILVLFHRSNMLGDFEGSEIPSARDGQRASKSYRLGYWKTTNRPNEIFYAIAEEHALARQYSLEGGKLKAKVATKTFAGQSMDLEGQRPARIDIHSPNVRFRWVPWFLKDTCVVAWIVVAVILVLAFVIISFVNRAVKRGFLPLLPAPTTSQGFSPANFLYSFVPSLIGMILFLLWQPVDLYFRALQPFANLSSTSGTTAERSLLLDHNASLPIEISIKAVLAGHYKVAWISFISLLSATLPVLAGGVFTAQFFPSSQDVRMAASMPAYEALVVFTVIYALSFLVIWPGRKRHLPHDIRTLGQLVSFFYQSPLLGDAAFKQPRSKIDLVTKLLASPGDKARPRYEFGVYFGRDGGREHLGIDRSP
ncbi:hypothetical protein MMC07_008910 [Pseudocyphellaria aurata]|nr:hypothetical protein [Pseudocyphellaria aurata]